MSADIQKHRRVPRNVSVRITEQPAGRDEYDGPGKLLVALIPHAPYADAESSEDARKAFDDYEVGASGFVLLAKRRALNYLCKAILPDEILQSAIPRVRRLAGPLEHLDHLRGAHGEILEVRYALESHIWRDRWGRPDPGGKVTWTRSGSRVIHGRHTAYYQHGCRCTECRLGSTAEAKWRRARAYQLVREHPEAVAHGTYSTYTNYQCRCEECKDAAAEYFDAVRRSREARRLRQQERELEDVIRSLDERGNLGKKKREEAKLPPHLRKPPTTAYSAR